MIKVELWVIPEERPQDKFSKIISLEHLPRKGEYIHLEADSNKMESEHVYEVLQVKHRVNYSGEPIWLTTLDVKPL